MSGQIKALLQGVSVAALGMLTGAGLALALTQYPGVFELRLGIEESYLKMDGSSLCPVEPKP